MDFRPRASESGAGMKTMDHVTSTRSFLSPIETFGDKLHQESRQHRAGCGERDGMGAWPTLNASRGPGRERRSRGVIPRDARWRLPSVIAFKRSIPVRITSVPTPGSPVNRCVSPEVAYRARKGNRAFGTAKAGHFFVQKDPCPNSPARSRANADFLKKRRSFCTGDRHEWEEDSFGSFRSAMGGAKSARRWAKNS